MKKEKFEQITDYLTTIIKGSEFYGHVFAVGGCCRDYLSGRDIKDIDLVVALPDGGIKFAHWLESNGYTKGTVVTYPHFGTAMFHLKEFPEYEIESVQTRKEAYRDIDTRNPETAYGTIKDDCMRRDFTYNAIYHSLTETGGMLDFNGNSLKDLEDNVLRTCGDPDIIFTEDPLRILRAVRFSSRFGSTIELETYNGMVKFVDRLSIISRERIYDEFKKMVTTGDYAKVRHAMCSLWDIGAFKYILPHVQSMGMRDRINLLNRIGRMYGEIFPTFEELMASIMFDCKSAEAELRELKCSNDEIREILFYINENKTLQAIIGNDDIEMYLSRKVMNECRTERKFLTSTLVGSYEVYNEFHSFLSDDYDDYSTLYYHLLEYEKEYFTYEIPVTGEDVMSELGIGPCEKVGKALDRLKKFAFINKDHKSREDLLGYLKYIKTEL